MNGLNNKEVQISRNKYGSNSLTKIKQKNLLSLILESLGDPMIKILLVVLGIKIFFLFQNSDWYETIGILIAIIIASLISALSEYGSEEAFKRLDEESQSSMSTVIRNGKIENILSKDIVVGDIILLFMGDSVPADGYIISGSIVVSEASINGESKEKRKNKGEFVYSSSVIYDGEARLKVDKVGDKTLIGTVAKEIQVASSPSPLKIRLSKLAKTISIFGYVGAILVAIIYLISTKDYSVNNLLYALTLSVTVVVVTVPEGLPMMIALVLSSNTKKMLKSNVLVRKLVGIETSGNLNCLLTDKTGTITEGKLKVINYVSPTLKKYNTIYEIPAKLQQEVNNNLFYNNSSYLDKDDNIVSGNQTDKSILAFSIKNDEYKIKDKTIFDSSKKYSSVTLDNDFIYLKGAKEVLLEKCLYYLDNDGQKKIITNIDKIAKEIDNISATGSRVIVLASKKDNKDSSLIYQGFLEIKDNIRQNAISSINKLRKSGINVIMTTGDNLNTAISIAKESNIITSKNDIAITSNQFNKMSSDEIIDIYPHLKVIARCLPQDKSRLVSILQNSDYVVGMTGDGINDSSALKKADVGFAMGSGTQVAKEASDIVILDDNIESICNAVLFGRTIFKSIRKFIIFQLTVNISAMLMAIIGPLFNISTPVTVIQMLWINMIMDTLAGIAFASEPPLSEYMDELPKSKKENIINKYMYQEIIITGIYSFIIGILFLKLPLTYSFIRYSPDNRYLLTAYFALFIFIGIFNALNSRTTRINIMSNISRNKPFIIIFTLISLIQLYLIYYGGNLFRTYGLNIQELIYVILLASTVIPFDWLRKILTKKKDKVI